MLTIKCTSCKSKIFKYQKVGKGRILTCWDARITKDFTKRQHGEVRCICGKIIGTEVLKGVRMKQGNFTTSGTRSNKL